MSAICTAFSTIMETNSCGEAAVKFGIDAVAKMPIDPKFAKACDNGEIEEVEGGWLDTIADKLLG